MRSAIRRTVLVGVLSTSAVIAGCPSDSGGPNQITLAIIAFLGLGQTATVGEAVAVRPAVRITNSSGDPVAGHTVSFLVTQGGGTATGTTQTTDANGVATVGSWIVGVTAGANALRATAEGNGVTGNPVTFTATANAGPAAAVAKQAGDAQNAIAGQAVATRPAVRVTDEHGNAASGVQVTFAVLTGGGTATGTAQTTDNNGVATVGTWNLGTLAGNNSLSATVVGHTIPGNPLTFNAVGMAGPAAILTKTTGDNQTAPVSSTLPIDPTVRVTDINNNPVAGVNVAFAVTAGLGTATGTAASTGADGIAAVGSWTLGAAAGANTLTATATGAGINGNPATFTATGTAATPTAMAAHEGNNQVARSGTAVPVDPAVRVTDAGGQPVAGVDVEFTVLTGSGLVTVGPNGVATDGAPLASLVVGTDANGVARVASWILGVAVGANSLRARIVGTAIADIIFAATSAFNPTVFAGIWIGGWNNITFGSNGTASVTITVDNVNKTMSFTLDLNGTVFGQGDPPAEVLNGSFASRTTMGISMQSNRLGALTLNISPTGVITGQSLNPAPGISRVDYSGNVGSTTMQFTSVITFTGGGSAVSVLNLAKQ